MNDISHLIKMLSICEINQTKCKTIATNKQITLTELENYIRKGCAHISILLYYDIGYSALNIIPYRGRYIANKNVVIDVYGNTKELPQKVYSIDRVIELSKEAILWDIVTSKRIYESRSYKMIDIPAIQALLDFNNIYDDLSHEYYIEPDLSQLINLYLLVLINSWALEDIFIDKMDIKDINVIVTIIRERIIIS